VVIFNQADTGEYLRTEDDWIFGLILFCLLVFCIFVD
jgi:hypothetical protein